MLEPPIASVCMSKSALMIRKSSPQLPKSVVLLWLSLLSLQSTNPMAMLVLVSWVIIDTMLEIPIFCSLATLTTFLHSTHPTVSICSEDTMLTRKIV